MLTKSITGLSFFLLLVGMLSMTGCASDGMTMDDSMDKSMDKSMMDDSGHDMKDSMKKDMGDSM